MKVKDRSMLMTRLLCSVTVLGVLGGLQAAPTISLVVPASGSADAPNNGSVFPLVSANERYVTFGSASTNLFPGQVDTNAGNDMFQRDTQTGTTTLISHAAGSPAVAMNTPFASQPRASNDGRFVIYATSATNLVIGQGGGQRPYLWDRDTNTNIFVADVQAQGVTISGDGNWLAIFALTTEAKPMPKNIYDAGQGSFTATVYTTGFAINRGTGAVTLISREASGSETPASMDLGSMWISENGRYYAFETQLYPAWGGYTGTFVVNSEALYLYDRVNDSMTLISKKNDGSAPPTQIINPTATYMSPDGRYVYFLQTDTDYGTASADTNGFGDMYRFDRDGGSTKLARLFHDVHPLAPQPDGVIGNTSSSPNGRFLTFSSVATNLVSGDTNGRTDVFRYDTSTDVLERVNVNSDGSQWTDAANGIPSAFGVGNPRVLNNGTVYFNSTARALGFTDNNLSQDILKADFGAVASEPSVTTASEADVTADSATLGGEVTADGGSAVSERGIVWSTATAPAINDSNDTKVANGSGTGAFSASVGSLPGGTVIYVRAYATNTTGTGYGSEISFTTGSSGPGPVPTTLGDVVSAGGAPGADGMASIGDFGLLSRGGSLAQNGHLVFPGTLEIGTGTPAVTLATASGLWKTAGGNLFLLARSGTVVPDVASARFSTLPEVPGISAGGDVSFLGTLEIGMGGVTVGNDTGLWSELGGTGLSLLIREDDDVPGVAGVKVGKFATGIYATATTGASTGQAAFSVTYKGASTKTALLRASVSGASTTVSVIATEGEDAPGTALDFANLAGSYSDPGRMDTAGNFVFSALTSPGNKEGIWYQPVSGAAAKVVVSGETAPGTSGATFSKIYRPAIGSSGVISFRASLNANGDNTLGTRNDGIWRGDAGNPASLACILRRGDDSSVVSNLTGGARVGNPWGGWLAASNRGAWKAWLDVNGDFVSAAPNDRHAIFTDLSGTMQLALVVNDPAPGTAGASFSGFDLPVVGGNNQYAFIGNLAGGDTVAGNNQGLWKSASNGGALALVLRKGDSILTSEGSKTVSKIDLPGSLQTDRRWEQPVMDSTGRMVVYITFEDGSTSQILVP